MQFFWPIMIMLAALVFVAFTFVVLFGAPFLPTLKKQVEPAITLLNLKPGQTLLELGSGDGRILQAAAKQGIYCIGYELNPLLVLVSKLRCFKQRKYVQVIWANYWQQTWPPADGIFTFLLNPYMPKLHTALEVYPYKPVKLVSFAFEIPNKKPIKTNQGSFLYIYR